MNAFHRLICSRLNLLRNLSACLLLTALLLSFAGIALANVSPATVSGIDAAPQTLKAAAYDYPPAMMINRGGQVDGFAVELLRAVLKSVGQDVIFETGTFAEADQKLRDGAVQIIPKLIRTLEREQFYDFTFPYLSSLGTLVVRKDETGVQHLADLTGKKVAMRHNGVAEGILWSGNLNVTIEETSTDVEALRQLASGQHDAVVIDQRLAQHLITKPELKNLKLVGRPLGSFVYAYSFAVNKGNAKLLAQLNKGLSNAITDGTYHALISKWHMRANDEVGEGHRTVFGGDANNYPYVFLDANGQPAGYTIDLLRAVAEQTGLAIDIRLGSWAEIRESLAKQEIDAIVGMYYSPERDRTFDFSPAHSLANFVIVSREEGKRAPQTLDDLAGKIFIVTDGDMMHDMAIQQGFATQLILATSYESALDAVASGERDYALVPKVAALMAISKNGWTHLRTSEQPIATFEFCFAVPHGRQALLNRLTEGLLAVKANGEYRQIYSKWLGVYEEPRLELWDVIKYSLYIVVPLLALLLATLLWSRTLKRNVNKATEQLYREIAEHKQTLAELDNKNQELDNKNRELERFTYTVSHDLKSPLITIRGFAGILEESLGERIDGDIRQSLDYINSAATKMYALLDDLLRLSRLGRVVSANERVELSAVAEEALTLIEGRMLGEKITVKIANDLPAVTGDHMRLREVMQNLLENAVKYRGDQPAPHIEVGTAEVDGQRACFVRDNGQGIAELYQTKVFGLFERLSHESEGTGIGLTLVQRIIELHGGRIWIESTGVAGEGTTVWFTLPWENAQTGSPTD